MVIAGQSRSNRGRQYPDVIASPSGRGDLLTFSAFPKIAASLSLLAMPTDANVYEIATSLPLLAMTMVSYVYEIASTI